MADRSTEGHETRMFESVGRCWVCGGTTLARFHLAKLDFTLFKDEDAELYAYTGQSVWMVRCAACGFGQPEQMPTLPGFFDRMYKQLWSEQWMSEEFESDYRDLIFRTVLRGLDRRVTARPRRLLDVGAQAGRFLDFARHDGWEVEGIELNPLAAAYAAARTGAPIYQQNAHQLAPDGRRYAAIVLSDVLEHIPEPLDLLRTLALLTEPGGSIAVKVPCGPNQLRKEQILAALLSRNVKLADSLVHVNQFTPRSLTLALERAGFDRVSVRTGAPELLPVPRDGWRARWANAVRWCVYTAGSMPGAVHTPLALNLQAFASRPPA